MLTRSKDTDSLVFLKLPYSDILTFVMGFYYKTHLILTIWNDKAFWRNKLEKDFPLSSNYLVYPEHIELKKSHPRKLMKPSQRIEYSVVNEFPTYYDEQDWIDQYEEKFISEVQNYPILRGDRVHVKELGDYGNSGIFIWDGEKLLHLDIAYNGYGAYPKEISFPEFDPEHFSRTIPHNSILFLSPEKVEEAIQNFDEFHQRTTIIGNYKTYYCGINCRGDHRQIWNIETFTAHIRRNPILDWDDNVKSWIIGGQHSSYTLVIEFVEN